MIFRKFKYNLSFFSWLNMYHLNPDSANTVIENSTGENKITNDESLRSTEITDPKNHEQNNEINDENTVSEKRILKMMKKQLRSFYDHNISETGPSILQQKQSKSEIKKGYQTYQKHFLILSAIFLVCFVGFIYYGKDQKLKDLFIPILIMYLIILFHINRFNQICAKIEIGTMTFTPDLLDFYFFLKYVIYIKSLVLLIMMGFCYMLQSSNLPETKEFLVLFYLVPMFLTYLNINKNHKKQINIVKKIFVLENDFLEKYKYLYNIIDKF